MEKLFEINPDVALFARADGLFISGVNSQTNFASLAIIEEAARPFFNSLSGMIAEGLVIDRDRGLLISNESLAEIESFEVDPLEVLFVWSPYKIKIDAKGTLGFPDYKFVHHFYSGKRLIPARILGPIVWRGDAVYRLRTGQASTLRAISEYNLNSDKSADLINLALDALYILQTAAKAGQVKLSDVLKSEEILRPQKIEIGIDDNGRQLSAYPIIEGVDSKSLKRHFHNMARVANVYNLEKDGGRQRILIDPGMKKIFESIKTRGAALSGSNRKRFLRDPRAILPESEDINPDAIDTSAFGPRVIGIGYPKFVKPISNIAKENWFDRAENQTELSDQEAKEEPSFGITCAFANGEEREVRFKSRNEANEFVDKLEDALVRGDDSIEYGEYSIPISDDLLRACKSAFRTQEKGKGLHLLIHRNEETGDYAEEIGTKRSEFSYQTPASLKKSVNLKTHQTIGVAWLQNLIHGSITRGGLLGDEMGVGKTLQVLTFLAWYLELCEKNNKHERSRPVLIVAPITLLENWASEINQYFDSRVFTPIVILHDKTLKSYKSPNKEGQELALGAETLDLARVASNRIVITNYATVKNYQYSFAKIPWSIVVTDESQEIKEPNTAVTHALKALNPLFRIACTGTPVETSLSNLWCLMDFVHPGNPLGTLKEFNSLYSAKSHEDESLGQELRSRLRYNKSDGFVLRRTKKEVLKDLPEKHFVRVECEMSPALRAQYAQLVSAAQNVKSQQSPLSALNELLLLSQHPFLLDENPYRENHNEYLAASPKLKAFVETLKQIRAKGEKVLVFAIRKSMQDILKATIDREFGLNVKIMNGSTKHKHQYVENTRKGMVKDFSEAPGFQVIILSPEVAGVGLTITAANHVIHYGRWWNPAVENQATDRAYRIGQTKPVYVYQFIYRDPLGELETFDQKLDRLLLSRSDLADNFLVPIGDESKLQTDIFSEIFRAKGDKKTETSTPESPITIGDLYRLSPFEFEALTAVLLHQKFDKILLTPRGRDGGADVVGISKSEIRLYQCKHRLDSGSVSDNDAALSELVDAQDYYRETMIPQKFSHLPVRLTLFTSARVSKEVQRKARDQEIEVVDYSAIGEMLKNHRITKTDIRGQELGRVKDIKKSLDQG